MAGDHGRLTMRTSLRPYALVGLPATFLLAFFVLPTLLLFSASILEIDGTEPTGALTLDNFQTLFAHKIYTDAILRTFTIGTATGALVVILAYPLAWVLTRTRSRWKNALIAAALAPLLASVIVRTYGWWVLLNREGAVNTILRTAGFEPVAFLPSTATIIVGLTHALLPYGVLTLMAALSGVNPSLERAAMSLGAGRLRTFWTITLPLTTTGIASGFLLAFAVAISAYATPAILGGPATQTMATLIYAFMTTLLNWGAGSATAVILLATSLLLFGVVNRLGRARA